ncbi:MAG: tyrosine-type recombinase/integrase [Chloroflexota bacterium]
MPTKRKIWSSKQDALNETESRMLLNGCVDLLDNLVVRLPLYAGMRIGEVAHLKASWLDFKKMLITIPARQLCNCPECSRRKQQGIWTPKSDAGQRALPITRELEPYLRQLGNDGIARSKRSLEFRFQKIRERSGLKKRCYPHALRATYLTGLSEMGISAPSLTYLAGWSSLRPSESYIQSSMKRAHKELSELSSGK